MSIKSFFMDNPMLKSRMLFVRRIGYSSILTVLRVCRVDKKKILFNNFDGKGYADNPKAVAEKVHELHPEYKLKWIISDDSDAESLPPYVKPVKLFSPAYFYDLATSSVWVFNVLSPRGLLKRKQQMYIQTHHGDRSAKNVYYMNIGKEASDKKHVIYDEICDYGTVGSKCGEKIFMDGIGFHGPLLQAGTPRDDCLVNPDKEKAAQIRKNLGVGEDTKLLLYAPTFRNGHKTLDCALDFDRILDKLEEKTGDQWLCLYRAHVHTKEIRFCGKTAEGDRYKNVSKYPDMADLLLVSDLLVSDYSSSPGDFCLTGRPTILFLDENETYNRSTFFDLNDSPHFIAKNQEEFEDIIESLDQQKIDENNKAVMEFYGIYETGHAAETVAGVIEQHIKSI